MQLTLDVICFLSIRSACTPAVITLCIMPITQSHSEPLELPR